KECCLMSAMSKRIRAERELAEQLRPSCAQPMDGCACGEGAAIRTVSASAAAAGMPIDAAHRATELAMAAARATGHPRRTAAQGGGQGRQPGTPPLSRAENPALAGRPGLGPCGIRPDSQRQLAEHRSSAAAAAARSAVRAVGRLAV